jgi:hypothetical protein
MQGLGGWFARPSDVPGIERGLEGAIDHVQAGGGPWWNEDFRATLCAEHVARQFEQMIPKAVE